MKKLTVNRQNLDGVDTGILKNKKGITLVALVVTIIILLILAGISIASLTGNGLFEKAKLAKEKQENAQIKEEETLTDYENKINQQYIDGTRANTGNELLEETTIYAGQEYTLKDSIQKYNKLEIFAGVNTSSGKSDLLWNSESIPVKSIIYYNNNNLNRSFVAVYVASNTSYYRTITITFSDENKIKVYSIDGSGWAVPSDGYRLIIYGY